jgi:ABC-2 type transport system ATP-binding protein
MNPSQGIELSHVSRQFRRKSVVQDVSLSIASGTTCGFIGLNGAGKTTTIRMIVGLLAPSAGEIRTAGFAMPQEIEKAKRSVGYVPDRPTVYPWMTGHEAISFCHAMYGAQWDTAWVDQLARSFRIDLATRVKHLSKGSAAKLSLLLAVGHRPSVIVLDEPTSGFDVLAREEFIEGILTINTQDGRPPPTVLFSSHALADVQRLVDTVAILHEGRLLLHEQIDTLLGRTKRIRSVLEDAPAATTAPPGTLREYRVGREWTVTVSDFSPTQVEYIRGRHAVAQLEVEDLTLDDVFRDYVQAEAHHPRQYAVHAGGVK